MDGDTPYFIDFSFIDYKVLSLTHTHLSILLKTYKTWKMLSLALTSYSVQQLYDNQDRESFCR